MNTNVQALNEIIEAHGLKKTWLADQLGISQSTFMVRLAGKVDFRYHEMATLCKLMHLTEEEKHAVGWVF